MRAASGHHALSFSFLLFSNPKNFTSTCCLGRLRLGIALNFLFIPWVYPVVWQNQSCNKQSHSYGQCVYHFLFSLVCGSKHIWLMPNILRLIGMNCIKLFPTIVISLKYPCPRLTTSAILRQGIYDHDQF